MNQTSAVPLGANPTSGGGVRFSVWAPRAEGLRVRVERPGGDVEQIFEAVGHGCFEAIVPEARAGDDYWLRIDAEPERPDPCSRFQPRGVHGPSRVVDPTAFSWNDSGWRGIERARLVIYEFHVGTFTQAGTFEAAIERLPALVELGVTALEIMPVAEFPGDRNWGYDGVFLYAPQSTYGGPEGLRSLVDAAHAAGLAVLLDVVYNHLGPEGNVLQDFGPYFTDHYRTPWGAAVNFDQAGSDAVRRFFRDNAHYWIREYHLDGLRLDAVHAIHDESARPFLAELSASLRQLESELGRQVHVIAESDSNDPRLVVAPERGGLGLDAVWNDEFHHALHALLTGERSGYYVDFTGLECVAKSYADRFVYDGVYSEHRQRTHGAPAGDIPADRFVVFAQNHDQIGNRALGERLSTLTTPARCRLAAAVLLLSPYIPLLFMGEEYGETAPFLYFVSHSDSDLIEAVRRGRSEEFATFGWRQEELSDPTDPETFQRSRLRPELAEQESHRRLRALYRDLLQLRREEPALLPGAARVQVAGLPSKGWFTATYEPPHGRAALVAIHVGPAEREVEVPLKHEAWQLRIVSDDRAYGGPGGSALDRLDRQADRTSRMVLPAESAVVYLSEAF